MRNFFQIFSLIRNFLSLPKWFGWIFRLIGFLKSGVMNIVIPIVMMLVGAATIAWSIFSSPLSFLLPAPHIYAAGVSLFLTGIILLKKPGSGTMEEVLKKEVEALKETQNAANDKIRDQEQTIRTQKEKIAELIQTGTTVRVGTISPILKLSLLEIETDLLDFQRRTVKSVPATTGWFGTNQKDTEYLAYLTERITVQYGIDLKKIHVQQDKQELIVSNIECQFQGLLKRDMNEPFFEAREKEISGKGETVSHKILPNSDPTALQEYVKHRDAIVDKLNRGIDVTGLKGLDQFVIERGKEQLRNLLAPTGLLIRFSEKELEHGIPYETYMTQHNSALQHPHATQLLQNQPSTN